MRARGNGRIYEAFPEMAYMRMNGYKALRASKHKGFGLLERRKLLAPAYGRALARTEGEAEGP